MPRNKDIKVKDKNLNVKLPKDDYEELQEIAEKIGGITLSSMIRIIIYFQLSKVRETNNPVEFLEVTEVAKDQHKYQMKKDRVLNVKLPEDDYTDLMKIANHIGISLSVMIRMLIYSQLYKVRKSKKPKDFLIKK